MSDSLLVYNDYVGREKRRVKAQLKRGDIGAIDYDSFYSEAFFALANTEQIGYRVSESDVVTVQQNINAADTTGGIVWESAYLLLDYLLQSKHQRCSVSAPTNESKKNPESNKRYDVIDLGAGTGLLGMVLSRFNNNVTVTEYDNKASAGGDCHSSSTSSVYKLLHENVTAHNAKFKEKAEETHNAVHIFPLDWSRGEQDVNNWIHADHSADTAFSKNNIESGSGSGGLAYDLVLGTDVLFSPTLVRPLLRTASLLTRAGSGTCLFCMQIRCQDSHQMFLDIVLEYFDTCCDLSESVYSTAGCAWGRYVECLVFEMKGGKVRAATEEESNPLPSSSSLSSSSSSSTTTTTTTTALDSLVKTSKKRKCRAEINE